MLFKQFIVFIKFYISQKKQIIISIKPLIITEAKATELIISRRRQI